MSYRILKLIAAAIALVYIAFAIAEHRPDTMPPHRLHDLRIPAR